MGYFTIVGLSRMEFSGGFGLGVSLFAIKVTDTA
jgi:hypothetical protein